MGTNVVFCEGKPHNNSAQANDKKQAGIFFKKVTVDQSQLRKSENVEKCWWPLFRPQLFS
jgi:hypothetical protein